MKFVYAGVLAMFLTASAEAKEFNVAQLSWLSGTWIGMKDGVEMEEHWSTVKAGTLLGMHRDIRGERMVSFEFIRIETTAEGIVYFASPRSATPTPFKLVEMTDARAVFENSQHDFPQRVLYWLDAQGALHARIEGSLRGKAASEEWVWTRL